jgi:hypothetical protein
MTVRKIIYSFAWEAHVCLTDVDRAKALPALNRHHYGEEAVPLEEKASEDHLNATYRMLMTQILRPFWVDVFDDGEFAVRAT